MSASWEDIQRQWQGFQSAAGSATDDAAARAARSAEIWRSWLSPGFAMPDLGAAEGVHAMFGQLLDPSAAPAAVNDFVAGAIRALTGGPQLADVDHSTQRMARVAELYTEVQAAKIRYDGVVAKAWTEANERFAAELSQTKPDTPLSSEAALRRWLDLADAALVRAHRTAEFLDAQRALLRAGTEFLLAQRELIEQLFEPAGMPTRSELDEVHRSVHQLKQRIRVLERTLAESDATRSAR